MNYNLPDLSDSTKEYLFTPILKGHAIKHLYNKIIIIVYTLKYMFF